MPRVLPIGVDDFEDLRSEPDFLYVDKTRWLPDLFAPGHGSRHVFLARPRRFGKTLLLSTLEALFQGRRELFVGTWIGREGHWDWQRNLHPVLCLDMDLRGYDDAARLERDLSHMLVELGSDHGVEISAAVSPEFQLRDLLRKMARQAGRKVVVLVDEYDKVLTENLDRSELLEPIQRIMRAFYGALKTSRRHVRFTFMTGITRFARTGLFSGANHFVDLSFRGRFGTLLGFTQTELQDEAGLGTLVARGADNLGCTRETLLAGLAHYYNGYRFSRKSEPVYNPFSLAGCLFELQDPLESGRWKPDRLPCYWAASGTPLLLMRLLQTHGLSQAAIAVNHAPSVVEEVRLDISQPNLAALMYQSGYLTRTWEDAPGADAERERLAFPNFEVEQAFAVSLREFLDNQAVAWRRQGPDRRHRWVEDIRQALTRRDAAALQRKIETYLRTFPYFLHRLPEAVRTVADYEMYYQALLHGCFSLVDGIVLHTEQATVAGRIDLVVEQSNEVSIIELKVRGDAERALRQALTDNYVFPYKTTGKPVTVFGMHFDMERRIVTDCRHWHLGTYDHDAERWRHEPFALSLYELNRLPPDEA